MIEVTKLRLFYRALSGLLLLAPSLGATDYTAGVQVGYGQGPGFMLNTTLSDFAKGFPFQARFGLAYTSLDPGDPLAARRTFINDATNGTPREDGQTWDLRCDLVYDYPFFPKHKTFIFGGPRYSRFRGNFKYVGGNEDFDVTSRQWGIGAGVESHYQFMSTKSTDLVVTAMLDYYLESPLRGHDTTYDPDGADINPRRDYTYGDADAAIKQPKWVPRIMVGFNHRLGK